MTDPDERMRRWRLVLGEAGVTMPLSGNPASLAQFKALLRPCLTPP